MRSDKYATNGLNATEVKELTGQEVPVHRSLRVSLYFARIVYGLLCAPFTIFLVPGVSNLLLHVNPTGYNRQGYCVPYMLRPSEEKSRMEKQRDSPPPSPRNTDALMKRPG